LFGDRGWSGTTLAAVAAEAGTAVETLYAVFGSKAGLLVAAIDAAIVGDDDGRPIEKRPEFARLGKGSRRARLSAAAAVATGALVRAVPLMGTLQQAASSDETARVRLERYETDRRATIATGLELVLGSRPEEHLVDAVWALAGPEVFTKLTCERGWSIERYQEWLVETGLHLLGTRDR
jgi:AcrR family transcriptional regulator